MEINIRRKCEVGARGSLFWDLVGTASFRLFSGNAVNNRGEVTKAAGRWRLQCGFWNTCTARTDKFASRNTRGEIRAIVHRHLGYATKFTQRDLLDTQMTVTHNELCSYANWRTENYAQTLTKSPVCKKKYTNITMHRQFCLSTKTGNEKA